MGNSLAPKKTKPAKGGAPALTLVPPVTPVHLEPDGFDGIANFAGNLQAESAPELRGTAGYGSPSSWGEFEKRMRTDEAASAALDFVISPIRDGRMEVAPPDDESLERLGLLKQKQLFVDQAAFAQWNLAESMSPGWPEYLQQTIRISLGVGFSLHEPLMAVCKHKLLPKGQGYQLAKLEERLPSTMANNAWQEDPETGELLSIRQQGNRGSRFVTADLDVADVLLNTWNRNGDNYAGFSAFRAVWYAMKIREQLLKLTAVTLVREGAGIPVAFATDPKAKLTKQQRAEFEKLLNSLVYHENANAVLPPGWDLDWKFSPGANKGHVVDTYNALGLLILRQLGAQQLVLGTGETGSRSVGEIHSAQSKIIIHGIVANLSGVLNGVPGRKYTGLIKRIIDPNWGEQEIYPRWKLTLPQAQLTPTELAEALAKGKAAGVFTPTFNDEVAFRERCGQPQISEEERDEAKEKAAALAPPSPFGPGAGKEDQEPEAKKPPFAKGKLSLAADGAFVPRRALRDSEKVLDLAAMVKTFDRSPEEFADGARPLIAEMLMKALPAVRRAMADKRIAGDEIAGIKLDTKRLDAFVGRHLEKLRASGYASVRGELERGSIPRGFRFAAEEDDKDTGPQTSVADEAHAEAQQTLAPIRKQLVRRMAARQLEALEKTAIDVLRTEGEPEEVVTRVLEQQATSGAYKQDAALVTTKAFSVGREEFAAEYADSIESVELSEVLDENTCSACELLDGLEFEFGSAEEVAHTPPHSAICHGGDRCRGLKLFNFRRGAA